MALPGAPPVALRPAGAGDFDPWLALYEAVAAERLWMGAEAPLDREARRGFFDRSLTDDGVAILLAEEEGRLVGAVNLVLVNGLVDLGMFVAPDRRGGGVGSALVEAAVDWARKGGAHKVSLGVWAHNHPARGLYAKHGFVTEGTRRRHARRRSGELWDVISMGLVLDESTPGGPGADRYRPPAPLAVPPGGLIADGAGGLLLRPWRTADLIALRAAVDDAEIHRWLDAIPHPYTEADASEFLSMNRRTLAEGLGVGLAVTRQGTVVGSIGLRREGGEPGVGEVGYWVAAGARGQGVATAATRALAEWALGPAGLHRLELYAAVDNAPSRRVAERAGFELEGIRRAWRVVHHEPTDFAAYARLSPSTSPRTT